MGSISGVFVGSDSANVCEDDRTIVRMVLSGVSDSTLTGLQLNRGGGGAGGVSSVSLWCRRNKVSGSMAKFDGRLKGIRVLVTGVDVVESGCQSVKMSSAGYSRRNYRE